MQKIIISFISLFFLTFSFIGAQDCKSYVVATKLSQVLVQEFGAPIELQNFDEISNNQKLLTVRGEQYFVGISEAFKSDPRYSLWYIESLSRVKATDMFFSQKKNKDKRTADVINGLAFSHQFCWETERKYTQITLIKKDVLETQLFAETESLWETAADELE